MIGQVLNVGIWINMPSEKVGGGFNYAMDMIDEIDKFKFNEEINFIFLSFYPYNEPYLKRVSKKEIYKVPESSFSIRYLKSIRKNYNSFLKGRFFVGRRLNALVDTRIRQSRLQALKEKNIHLMFYPVQHQVLFDDFPFVSNNWDLGHLSTFSFPELAGANEYDARNRWYHSVFKKAFAIFVESKQGQKELVQYLSIQPEKIMVVPHFYSSEPANEDQSESKQFLDKHSLTQNEYLFYPAQFWAHKNHYNLVQGFKAFLENSNGNNHLKLILTGSDQGNLKYILDLVNQYGLQSNIKYLGFVTKAEISILYRNALSLIFPSFLGPSNLPLIEAFNHHCMVICSDLEGHKEMCKDAALYFNPDSPSEISSCISRLLDDQTQSALRSSVERWLNSENYSAGRAMSSLEKNFLELKNIRLTWQ